MGISCSVIAYQINYPHISIGLTLIPLSDFDAPPTVMLLGQYSTGKTTFIKYLLETDYPGLRIGPEPTTDKFVAIMHGEQDQVGSYHFNLQIYKNCFAVHKIMKPIQ